VCVGLTRFGSQRGGTPSGAAQKGRIAWFATIVNHSLLDRNAEAFRPADQALVWT